MMSFKKKCEVCSEIESKYKCPKCFVLYCSLKCFKTHKETCKTPEDLKSSENAQSELAINTVKLVDYDESEEIKSNTSIEITNTDPDLIRIDKLKNLENSDELKQVMANKHLRELLTKLNEHDENIDQKINEAMQEPLFQEFSSLCLKLVQNTSDLQKN